MEARLRGLIRNLDLPAQGDDRVECLLLRRPGIDAGNDTQFATAIDERRQLVPNQSEACEPHKGAQQIDPIGARKLPHDLRSNLIVPMPIDKEGAFAQRDQGSSSRSPCDRDRAWRPDFAQDPRTVGNVVEFDYHACRGRLPEHPKERIDDGHLGQELGLVIAAHARDRTASDIVHVASKQVG